jgi:hypothetical protein
VAQGHWHRRLRVEPHDRFTASHQRCGQRRGGDTIASSFLRAHTIQQNRHYSAHHRSAPPPTPHSPCADHSVEGLSREGVHHRGPDVPGGDSRLGVWGATTRLDRQSHAVGYQRPAMEASPCARAVPGPRRCATRAHLGLFGECANIVEIQWSCGSPALFPFRHVWAKLFVQRVGQGVTELLC